MENTCITASFHSEWLFWGPKNSLAYTLSLLLTKVWRYQRGNQLKVPVLSQEGERSCIWVVGGIDIISVSTIVRFDLGIVLTVWYCLFFIYILYRTCLSLLYILIDWLLVFNATFSNISAISWRPALVVEEAGIPGENHRPWASNC